MARPKKDPNDPISYNFDIKSCEGMRKTLNRLANMCANNKLDISQIRMINEIVRTMISLQRNIELEDRLQQLEDLLQTREDEQRGE